MTPPLELSRRIPVDRLGADGLVTVEASPAERAAVAARLMLPAIGALRCEWRLRPGAAAAIAASGRLQAEMTQLCVVTLEPFDARMCEDFAVEFVVEGRQSEDDDPEQPDQLVYDGVAVDLGEATVEQLALALDPYPRKPGAMLPDLDEDGPAGAFAGLAKLRRID